MGPLFKVSSERPEKPKIKPMTPGLEGEQLDQYSFTVQVKLQNDIPRKEVSWDPVPDPETQGLGVRQCRIPRHFPMNGSGSGSTFICPVSESE